MSVRAYVRDFGRTRIAVAERSMPGGYLRTAWEPIGRQTPPPCVWARLIAQLAARTWPEAQ